MVGIGRQCNSRCASACGAGRKPRAHFALSAVIWIFLSIVFQLCALILLKLTAATGSQGFVGVIFHPYVFLAFFLLACQALVWQLALKVYPLHRAYAFQALVFPLALSVGVGGGIRRVCDGIKNYGCYIDCDWRLSEPNWFMSVEYYYLLTLSGVVATSFAHVLMKLSAQRGAECNKNLD